MPFEAIVGLSAFVAGGLVAWKLTAVLSRVAVVEAQAALAGAEQALGAEQHSHDATRAAFAAERLRWADEEARYKAAQVAQQAQIAQLQEVIRAAATRDPVLARARLRGVLPGSGTPPT